MKILRTPDSCFEGLTDYPFEPNYTTIKTHDGQDLRIHHIDEGLLAKLLSNVLCGMVIGVTLKIMSAK